MFVTAVAWTEAIKSFIAFLPLPGKCPQSLGCDMPLLS